MKSANAFILALTLVSAAALTSCSKGGTDPDDKPAAGQDKTAAAPSETKPGVTLDTETQERIGIKMETPAPAQWQPGIHITGRVANPLTFISAMTDYETARSTAAASQAELERTKKLAAQENASPRVLEAAQTAATHDNLALQAAQAKFAGDWGGKLAAETNLAAYAAQLQNGNLSLVKLA